MSNPRFVTVDVMLLDDKLQTVKRAVADLDRFIERYKAAADAAAHTYANGSDAKETRV